MKNKFQKNFKALVVSFLFLTNSLLADDPITLTFHHFMSPKAPPNFKVLEPFAKQIEKASNGRIKIEMFPSMTLGGKPNELYKQVRDGAADIVFTIAGYSPGVFIRSEAFELPTVHRNNSLKTALAMKENFDLIKEDYKDVKPLLVGVAGNYFLHTVDKKITKISDVQGLKLRTPSRTGSWYINEMGAEPVAMPLPTTPQALSKNAVDGAVLPMEIVPPYKIHQLTKYSTQLHNGGSFGNSVCLVLMNKKRFESLPKDLQKIIDEAAGMNLINMYGQLMIDLEGPGKSLQKKSGGEIVEISEAETKKFDAAAKRTIQKWVKEMKAVGIDGQEIIDAANKSLDKL